mgnify:FL=1
MAARFLSEEGPYGSRFRADTSRVAALVTLFMDSARRTAGFLAEIDGAVVGMFGVFCLTHPITGDEMASELCWWVEPEARGTSAGLKLLKAAEAWAREQGASFLEMIAPSDRVAALYERLGFERTDIHYLKRL